MIATTMNINETIATDAFALEAATSRTPSLKVALKVPATIDAKAATTRMSVR